MADTTYTLTLNNPGYYTFTMPSGFLPEVEVHMWGAGGGNGSGARGGGGGYSYANVVIAAGSICHVVVGGAGGPPPGGRWSAGGAAGSGASIGFRGGAGAAQGDPEDGDAGGSGGGGGATALLVSNTIEVVAAGGGGGGGYGEDGAGGATPGLPGGIYAAQATSIYPVTLSYAWNSFMNSYAVWGAGQDYTVTINFPVTGTYTFYYSVDNYGSVFLDGTQIISYAGFGSTTSYSQTVASGTHTVRVTGVNTGGPAGIALRITKPDTTELWNTRYLIYTDGLTDTTNGENGRRGGAGGAGGGGGGYLGGETSVAYGDDGPGGGGGNGGLNYGQITIPGSGTTAGGRSTLYAATVPYGNQGYGGYAVLVFTKEERFFSKVNNGNVSVTFSGNIYANIGDYLIQNNSSAALAVNSITSANVLQGQYDNPANILTTESGNITVIYDNGNSSVDTGVYPVSTADQGDWTTVETTYIKQPPRTIDRQVTVAVPTGTSTTTTQRQSRTFVGVGSFTVPTGVTSLEVTVIGGGGSGASGHELNPVTEGGGGGGGGGINTQTISVYAGQKIDYTVGAGGAGVPTAGYDGGRNGNDGSSSTFGDITASGGGGGISRPTAGGAAGSPGGVAGAAGESRGGDTTAAGGAGGRVPGYSTGGTGGARGANPGGAGVGPGAGSGGGGGVGGSGVPTMGGSAAGNPGAIYISYNQTTVTDHVTYQQITETIEVDPGGWKEVDRIYVKDSGSWKPLITSSTITTAKLE